MIILFNNHEIVILIQFRWHFSVPRESTHVCNGIARAFPGGRVAHLESQNEEENEESFRKNMKNWLRFEKRMRKVELLPTRDCEAGYSPACIVHAIIYILSSLNHW